MRISDWSLDVCSSDLLEIGRGGDNRGVVAAEFEDRFAETARHALADGAAHACRTGCRDHRQTRIVDELLAKFSSADEPACETLRRFLAEPLHRSEEPTSELPSLMLNSYAVFCLTQ